MLSVIILCNAVLSVLIMRVVVDKFNSLVVLIDHEYQVLPTVKLPKYCSDVTGAQEYRHTGHDWRDDSREKMPGERRSTRRMTSDDEEEVTSERKCSRLRRSCVSKDSEDEDGEELPSRQRLARLRTRKTVKDSEDEKLAKKATSAKEEEPNKAAKKDSEDEPDGEESDDAVERGKRSSRGVMRSNDDKTKTRKRQNEDGVTSQDKPSIRSKDGDGGSRGRVGQKSDGTNGLTQSLNRAESVIGNQDSSGSGPAGVSGDKMDSDYHVAHIEMKHIDESPVISSSPWCHVVNDQSFKDFQVFMCVGKTLKITTSDLVRCDAASFKNLQQSIDATQSEQLELGSESNGQELSVKFVALPKHNKEARVEVTLVRGSFMISNLCRVGRASSKSNMCRVRRAQAPFLGNNRQMIRSRRTTRNGSNLHLANLRYDFRK